MRGVIERAGLLAIIALPTVYLFDSAYPLARVLWVLLEVYTVILVTNHSSKYQLPRAVLVCYLSAIVLILYMLVVDVLINRYMQGVNDFINRLITISMLPVLTIMSSTIVDKYKTVFIYSLIPVMFGIVQVFNPNFTIQSIWPPNPIIEPYRMQSITAAEYIAKHSRVVGTENLAIGFSLLLGIVMCIVLARMKGFFRIILLLILAYVMYNTQTRSAVYGMVIVIAYYALVQLKKHKISKLITLVLFVLTGYYLFGVLENNPTNIRLSDPLDNNTYGKIVSAYIGVQATLRTNPIFGISRDQLERQIMEEYATLNYSFIDKNLSMEAMITNHNQFVWYLRYYGIIGALGIIVLHINIWKLINRNREEVKILQRIIFIYIVLFSLMHNTNIVILPLFWYILSDQDRIRKDGLLLKDRQSIVR